MRKIITFLIILILLINICSITALCEESPTAKSYYSISVGLEGRGYAEIDKISVETGSNEPITLIAKIGDYPFMHWNIEGEYDILEGSTYSTTFIIIPKSDIKATAVFKGEGYAFINEDKTSPKTGQDTNTLYIILAILCICAIGIMFSSYKIKKNIGL